MTAAHLQSVTVKHNAETAHRLPFLGGKCENLHGHSWNVEVTIHGDVDAEGILLEFAAAKRAIREWVDTHLDHGTMLGETDSLVPVLEAEASKLFVFGQHPATLADAYGYTGRRALPWPTVENVAELLRRVTILLVPAAANVDVTVTETAVNAATARTLP